MTTDIKYTVTKLWASPETVNGFDDVVFNVFFDIIATDESNNVGKFNGIVNLDPPAEDHKGYIPYKDLSENQLIEWTKNSLGEDAIQNMERQAIESIVIRENPLPWKS